MPEAFRGPLTVLARVLLCAIFFMSAVGNKIPNFNGVAGFMATRGLPALEVLLAGAIVFLIAGSVSVIVGYKARLGALLLLTFLVLATYFFHDFWNSPTPEEKMAQTAHFMKNLSLMGAMLFIIANGAGAMSVDGRPAKEPAYQQEALPVG